MSLLAFAVRFLSAILVSV